MNATVLNRPTAPDVKRTPLRAPTKVIDPFEGKPLARALHIAGIEILDATDVKSDQETYRRATCATMAKNYADALSLSQWREKMTWRQLYDENYTLLMCNARWQSYPLDAYEKMVVGIIEPLPNLEVPPIPPDVKSIVAEVKARVSGATFHIECLYKDPYVWTKLGSELYCIAHF